MPLTPGTKLSHYEVVESIGAGGMGEVYRARDTKLGRDVAIKVLPEEFARDKERLDRFEREARLLAQLNHPNIATLHGLEEDEGQRFLVMELVEGETLAERIADGPVLVDEAIPLFIQIAEGLEAAHEKGIIHRDLKPANIKVGPDGKPKILDFGLAKAFVGDTEATPDSSRSPTLTKGTALGAIMGTAAYMSPEQAKGKALDRRTDIWAFGCCLFEALSGRRAFAREDLSDTLAAVLRDEPDWSRLPASVPVRVRELLERTVRKDTNRRWHDIADLRIELQESSGPSPSATGSPLPARKLLVAILSGLLLGATMMAIAWWASSTHTPIDRHDVVRSVIPVAPAEDLDINLFADRVVLAISRDSKYVAFVADRDGQALLYVRALSEPSAVALAGTEGAMMPFFSPDGQTIGFFADSKLKKIPRSGGASVEIADAPLGIGASWGEDGTIVFSPGEVAGLMRVSAEGGSAEVLAAADRDLGEGSYRFPQWLPGGRAVLFAVEVSGKPAAESRIAVVELDSGRKTVILEGTAVARYVASGHLVYGRDGQLLAVPFDLSSLKTTGTADAVLDGISWTTSFGINQFAVSDAGSLVYVPGGRRSRDSRLVWVSRDGVKEALSAPARSYTGPRLSRDGRRVLVGTMAANDDVWLLDANVGTLARQTLDDDNFYAVWSPDERHAVMSMQKTGPTNLHLLSLDGSNGKTRLLESENEQYPTSWSADGRWVAYTEHHAGTGGDIWILDMQGEAAAKPFQATPFRERQGTFSPDGKWLAYVSNETGRAEVYVRPLSGPGKFAVSVDGGTEPVWARNGRELFYRDNNKLMVVTVNMEPTFRAGTPQMLFEKPSTTTPWNDEVAQYDVSPDGERFLMVEPVEPVRAKDIMLVQNWFQELERLVPTHN